MEGEQAAVPPEGGASSGGNQKNNKTLIVIIVVIVLLVLGWFIVSRFTAEHMAEYAIERATGGDIDIDMRSDDEGEVTITTDEGTFEYSAGGSVSLPDNWPDDLPIMDEGSITYAGSMSPTAGEAGAVVVFDVDGSVSGVADYYKRALADNGWAVEATMQTGEMTIVSAAKDERTVGISIVAGDVVTTVTISTGS